MTMTLSRGLRRLRQDQLFRAHVWKMLILRGCFTLLPLSYIHPDEFFQSPEPMAKAVFGRTEMELPWEWDLDNPEGGHAAQRSVVAPFLVSGLPFYLLRMVFGRNPPAVLLFLAPRTVMLCLSIVIDIVAELICDAYRRDKEACRFAVGTASWVSLVFMGRPFSNSIEAVIFALTLGAALLLQDKPQRQYLIGVLFSIGVFNRFTFVLFIPAIVIGLLLEPGQNRPLVPKFAKTMRTLFQIFLSGLFSSAAFAACDSIFFGTLTIAPFNNAMYNLNSDNLAKHGLHPRYLHIVVNLPMLFGPAAVAALCSRNFKKTSPRRKLNADAFCWWCAVTPLLLLSIAPHQEARFLVPLLLPLGILSSPFLGRARRIWRMLTIFHCVGLAMFWGVLHQGALLRACMDRFSRPGCVVFAQTYMPPTYLASAENMTIIDVSDADLNVALERGFACSGRDPFTVIAPSVTFESMVMYDDDWRTLDESSFYPHISTEHPPSSIWSATLRARVVQRAPPGSGRNRV
eukprot:g3881.t1